MGLRVINRSVEAELGRRAVASLLVASTSLTPPSTELTLSQAVDVVREQCDPEFLSAVLSSGQFLYRLWLVIGTLPLWSKRSSRYR